MFRFLLLLAIFQLSCSENIGSHVVGGSEAFRGQFPYVVSLRYWPLYLHRCSGSILNTRWILTAAYCISGNPLIELVVGSNKLSEIEARFQPEKFVIHPRYRSTLNPLQTNDIGLIKTDFMIEFNEFIRPVRIRKDFIGQNNFAMVAGFGATEMFPGDPSAPIGDVNYPQMSETLQWIQLNVITNLNCNARIALALFLGEIPLGVRSSQICTFNGPTRGICYGDTGAGLLLFGEIIGVASRSVLPCARGMPDIYTRVADFADWIES